MAAHDILLVFLVLSCLAATSHCITFSSLPNNIIVSASTKQGQVLKAGEANITVTWSLNTTLATGTDSTYRTAKIKLCYAPVSQRDRAWRKTAEDLDKDKTCQHMIGAKPYSPSDNIFTWKVQRDIPTATYFIRVYVLNSADVVVAYGQTTDGHKTTNLFDVEAISGRHVSLDIASVCFSVFSVVSLFAFFFLEKRKSKNSLQI